MRPMSSPLDDDFTWLPPLVARDFQAIKEAEHRVYVRIVEERETYTFEVSSRVKAQQHVDRILKSGYTHLASEDPLNVKFYPAHRIAYVAIQELSPVTPA